MEYETRGKGWRIAWINPIGYGQEGRRGRDSVEAVAATMPGVAAVLAAKAAIAKEVATNRLRANRDEGNFFIVASHGDIDWHIMLTSADAEETRAKPLLSLEYGNWQTKASGDIPAPLTTALRALGGG